MTPRSNTDNCSSQGSGFKGQRTDLVVELAVDGLAVVIDELEGMRAVAVHVAVAVGKTTVTEQEGHLQEEGTSTTLGNNVNKHYFSHRYFFNITLEAM